MVETANNMFSDLIAPITNASAEVGRLLEAKFNRWNGAEMIFVTDAVKRAIEKIEASKRQVSASLKLNVLLASVQGAANESDDSIRELWANFFDEPSDFSREQLNRLGVITLSKGSWTLTHLGAEFLKAVTDPALLQE